MSPTEPTPQRSRRVLPFVLTVVVTAIAAALIAGLLVSIYQRKQEAKNPYLRFVNVDENTTDPAQWGKNWPREYDSYLRTVDQTHTRYGGSEAMTSQKLDRDPWLKKMFAGYAFAIDYRDRRGHAYMLSDQEQTERVTAKPQPGACLHCHASVIPTYRRLGLAAEKGIKPGDPAAAEIQMPGNELNLPAVMKGFEVLGAMKYSEAHAELLKTPDGTPRETKPTAGGSSVTATTPANTGGPPAGAPTTQEVLSVHANIGEAHPVSCVDCHDPQTMQLRVTRPGFINGIQALAKSDAPVPHLPSVERWRQGNRAEPYDPNRDATRQEMRSFACAQCHVEYYCGPRTTLFFPWDKGLKVEQIEQHYENTKFPDGEAFFDWKHGITGAKVFKAQHPEFEMWSQGVHARSGVSCADCHMPYIRQGALKVSDHWVRSPLLQVNRSCQTCHPYPEEELKARVARIQDTTRGQIDRAAAALSDMIDAIVAAKSAGATEDQLKAAYDLQRKAQWRLDYVYAENSMGFHADQEVARILGEAMDLARQGQIAAMSLRTPDAPPTTMPAAPVQGVTPSEKAPASPPGH